jgi:hypothetical protein
MECSECKKLFSEKKNLLKHKRNVHNIYCVPKERRKDSTTNTYNCVYCKKEYNKSSVRWFHEKKCKIIYEEKQINDSLLKEEENKKQVKEIEKLKKNITELKNPISSKDFENIVSLLLTKR